MIFGLRITQRCMREDFGYPDGSDFVVALEHPIVRDFLRSRREDPEGSEGVIASLGVPFMKLKAGDRERGVTIWERKPQGRDGIEDPALPFAGVVWLAGFGYRKEGDKHDAYEHFEKTSASRLVPTQADYELLYADIQREVYESLVEELERVMNELLERAWREPGHLHEERVEIGHLGVAITVLDYAEYRIAILPALDDSNRPVSLDILELLVRVIFGKECRLADLEPADPEMLAAVGYRGRASDLALAQLRGSSRPHPPTT